MSATKRGGKRRKGDAYYTPDDLARALVECVAPFVPPPKPQTILEPHCGGGAFVEACADAWPCAHITALDIVERSCHAAHRVYRGDFLETSVKPGEGYDLIIGNPPYKDAEKHVRHALKLGGVVAFLLRLAFLEGKARIPFWREYPATHVIALSERPSFTGGGTDATAYGFFIWAQPRRTTLEVLSWKGQGAK